MNTRELLNNSVITHIFGDQSLLDTSVQDLCYNTNTVKPSTIFFALKGKTSDGATFIPKAYENGGRIFVSETIVDIPEDSVLVIVENCRLALSHASHLFFQKPSEQLKVIGITGTKGKTTTTTLLYHVLKNSGASVGVIGTNGIFFNDTSIPTANTTPESYELHKIMRQMVDAGITTCFMEVSSQGLMMQRVEDIQFDIAVFTNMAVDHISDQEHPTFEDYLHWKTHLFTLTKHALVNQDDAYVEHFIKHPNVEITSYSIDTPSMYQATHLSYLFENAEHGMQFTLHNNAITLPVPGKFNVYNALVVIAVATMLNIPIETVMTQLKHATVPGRMEAIPNKKGALAILDYAHNGFSLENVIQTLQHYTYKRLIILFGSVGDRSQSRRQELGDVVARYADVAIITSDNPGFENPTAIIQDIEKSFTNSSCHVMTETDRQQAIKLAAQIAQSGDIVVFAGKGHETYQLIKGEKVPFNEKQIIIDAFEKAD